MSKVRWFLAFSMLVFVHMLNAQVKYTANDKVVHYGEKEKEFFLYGANMDWRNASWTDEIMGTILCSDPAQYGNEGPNANSLRPALYDRFVAQYGIDYRLPTFEHYVSKGAKVNTIFLSGPRKEYQERTCPLTPDEEKLTYELPFSFKNLYKPIWKTENGVTVVNPENYYAQYVYDVVLKYKPYTRFWEIWNEPDLTYKGNGDKEPGQTGNWWDADPDPCELHNLRSPIQHYIRLLRISYEVIKSVDEDAIVCTGGLGYSSFLDAVLRNTDNPDGGRITSEYPLKGGAYFDCVSYHVYPMYYLRKWTGRDDQHPDGFTYFRHTDAAVEASVNHQKKMENVLNVHGYNGVLYPKKEWILSETNIPSKRVKGNDENGKKWFIGSDEAQRNYLTKIAVTCQKNEVDAIYIYRPYDNNQNGNEGEYDVMGFYEPLPDTPGSKLILKPGGKAWRTMVKILSERKYNAEETSKLDFNSVWESKVDGGAFYSSQKKDFVYVLWAKTSKDLDETASLEYTFPSYMGVKSITYTSWDGSTTSVNGNEITLTGSPVFITVSTESVANIPVTGIRIEPSSAELTVGQSSVLKCVILPENASNKKVIWYSSADTIVKVDSLGKVTALKAGIAHINARSVENNSVHIAAKVTVLESNNPFVPVESLEMVRSFNMRVGSTDVLTATIIPTNATDQRMEWYSSDDKVVAVDSTGKMTAHKAGVAWINARSLENSSAHIACKVTVDEAVQRSGLFMSDDLSLLDFYPNPVKEKLYINGTQEGEPIEIYTLTGQLVKTMAAHEGQTTIECSQFTPGFYIVKIRGEIKKIVKR